jgi:2-polyprenyl-6-methoxyphenol hydroxylase-like FAD-dependent oxidoreductase
MNTSVKPRAVIVGGSLSGLFTATTLRHAGWDVDVFELSPNELDSRGVRATAPYGRQHDQGCRQRTCTGNYARISGALARWERAQLQLGFRMTDLGVSLGNRLMNIEP